MKKIFFQLPNLLLSIFLIWLHFTWSSPWLFNHGSSSAFDFSIGIWIVLLVYFVYSLAIGYDAAKNYKR